MSVSVPLDVALRDGSEEVVRLLVSVSVRDSLKVVVPVAVCVRVGEIVLLLVVEIVEDLRERVFETDRVIDASSVIEALSVGVGGGVIVSVNDELWVPEGSVDETDVPEPDRVTSERVFV